MTESRNVLITGAAQRIGAACARTLHAQGYNVIVHYNRSESMALALVAELTRLRPDSAVGIQADLLDHAELQQLAAKAQHQWNGLDVLINNASLFYAQSVEDTNESSWDALMGSNLKAPFFLAQALVPGLRARQGNIVNIIDIHSERGLPGYPVYSIAKAGLEAMTRVLAKELAPEIRVNGVSPGAILWPTEGNTQGQQAEILRRIALQRQGHPDDIAKAVLYLCRDAAYVTGQILKVDGGRSLFC